MKQLPIVRGDSPTDLTIDVLDTPEASTSIAVHLYQGEALSCSVSAGIGALAPTTNSGYQTLWGTDETLKLEFAQSGKSAGAHGGFFFESVDQKTTITNQNLESIGVYFGLSFDAFSKKE